MNDWLDGKLHITPDEQRLMDWVDDPQLTSLEECDILEEL